MSWFSSMFSVDTVDSVVDAVINTGDKLVYTEEEKAEMRLSVGNLHIKMLEAYHPFKITQRNGNRQAYNLTSCPPRKRKCALVMLLYLWHNTNRPRQRAIHGPQRTSQTVCNVLG